MEQSKACQSTASAGWAGAVKDYLTTRTAEERSAVQRTLPGVLDVTEAPVGYCAVLKDDAKPKDGSNICRACDWRPECQRPETDFTQTRHRCMPWAREDGASVLFKRLTPAQP